MLRITYAIWAFYASDELKNVKEHHENGISSIIKLIKTVFISNSKMFKRRKREIKCREDEITWCFLFTNRTKN